MRQAGRMTSHLAFYQPQRIKKPTGGYETAYVEQPYRECAQLLHMNGSRSEEVGEHFDDSRAEYLIAKEIPVHEKWRVRDLDEDILYDVISAKREGWGPMRRLVCNRVNE